MIECLCRVCNPVVCTSDLLAVRPSPIVSAWSNMSCGHGLLLPRLTNNATTWKILCFKILCRDTMTMRSLSRQKIYEKSITIEKSLSRQNSYEKSVARTPRSSARLERVAALPAFARQLCHVRQNLLSRPALSRHKLSLSRHSFSLP